jgi:hypothetical protein
MNLLDKQRSIRVPGSTDLTAFQVGQHLIAALGKQRATVLFNVDEQGRFQGATVVEETGPLAD